VTGGPADVIVSVTVTRPEERQLLGALLAEGLRAEIANPAALAGHLGECRLPRLVLVRNVSHQQAVLVSRLCHAAGVPALNGWSAIETCTDKASQALAFRRAGIPHPDTAVAFDLDEVRRLGGRHRGDYVIKPIDGSWGRGVVRITGQAALDSWIGARESLDPAHKSFPVIVQEYVETGCADVRAVVVGTTPVVAFQRVATGWKTNTHGGAAVVPIAIEPEVRELCGRLVDLVSPGFYGVDLLRSARDGAWLVCEINHNPDFSRSSAVHGVDVPRLVAGYVRGLVDAR
jgi:[lysine-biosynthesis-protein LysW]--L-2-aminoadipate ligase